MGLQMVFHGPAARMTGLVSILIFLVPHLSYGIDYRKPNARIDKAVFYKAETPDSYKMDFDRKPMDGTKSWKIYQLGGEGCVPRNFENMTFPIRMPCTCADSDLILAEEVFGRMTSFWSYTTISDKDERRREICRQTAPKRQVDNSFNLLYIIPIIVAVGAVIVAFGIVWMFCYPFSGAGVHEGNKPGVEMLEGGQRLVEPVA